MNAEQYLWLFRKHLGSLKAEILAYTREEELWIVSGQISNSAGHLCQHLIGNLKTFVGKEMGGHPYTRERDKEFNLRQYDREQLLALIDETLTLIESSLSGMSPEDLDRPYDRSIVDIKEGQTVSFILVYLLNHLNYHLGQINYHRRLLSTAI